jgi:predicted DNA-binding transcriptional regulator AlpA
MFDKECYMAEKTVVTGLAELPAESIVFKKALAEMLGKSTVTIDRMVRRCELPKPVRFTNQDVWTAGALRGHMNQRLDTAAKERAKMQARISELAS